MQTDVLLKRNIGKRLMPMILLLDLTEKNPEIQYIFQRHYSAPKFKIRSFFRVIFVNLKVNLKDHNLRYFLHQSSFALFSAKN